MRVLGVLFYSAVLILLGVAIILFAFVFSLKNNPIQPQHINDLILYIQGSTPTRLILALSGLLVILISFFFAQLILGRYQREKTIAFNTPSGEVTIALTAVEDLIKRLAGMMPEIKELRPDVIAKKGIIIVDLRVVLKFEASLPDLTSRLQELTRTKIQEVLGVEEQIVVKVHIAKIIAQEEKEKKRKEIDKEESTLPFGGYGRV